MAYIFTYVYTNDNDYVLAEREDIVVLTAVPAGGGGPGLLEIPSITRIPFEIELNVDGVKAFKIKKMITMYGIISKIVEKALTVIGKISKIKIQEIALNGVFGKTFSDELKVIGVKIDNLLELNINGIIRVETETTQLLKGTINRNFELFDKINGIKINPVESIYNIKGKRDIRKIILSLLNIE